ncbi:MAG: hypothetical protein WD991_00075 [Candidatus Paceibacterota bacterium]
MQIKFSKKKKILHKGTVHINPDIYWQMICLSALTLAVLGCVFGFYLFTKVNKDFISLGEEDANTAEKVKKERLDSALEYFQERKERSSDILSSPSPIVDPSL